MLPLFLYFGAIIFAMLLLICLALEHQQLPAGGSNQAGAAAQYGMLMQRQLRQGIAEPAPPPVLPGCPWGNLSDSSELLLLRGGDVYDPSPLGKRDLLIGGGKILRILKPDSSTAKALAKADDVRVLDATGLVVTPGLVDMHVHVTGGGGEAGPGSSVPAARLSEMLQGGLSTVVGVLGTDSITRPVESLANTVAGLNRAPITAFMYTGAYRSVPSSPTITGSVMKDIAMLDPVVGVGEVAISDFRGSHPSGQQLADLASDAQVGGLLGGKAGVVYCHMGNNEQVFEDLWAAVKISGVAYTQIIPTHVGRTPALAKAAAGWLAAGGYADVSANSVAPSVVEGFIKQGLAQERILVSSDAYGSLPKFDAQKRLVGYDYARPNLLLQFLNSMLGLGYDLATILPLVTRNPATALKLPRGKGRLVEGGDADVALMVPHSKPSEAASVTRQTLQGGDKVQLKYLFNKGILALSPDCVAKGMFEDA